MSLGSEGLEKGRFVLDAFAREAPPLRSQLVADSEFHRAGRRPPTAL